MSVRSVARVFSVIVIVIVIGIASIAAYYALENTGLKSQSSSSVAQSTSSFTTSPSSSLSSSETFGTESSITLVSSSATSSQLSMSATSTNSEISGSEWLTYHNDNSRDGYDPNEPSVLSVPPAPDWMSPKLDGAMYAEPLVYNQMVIAVTENNSVYALNDTNGEIIWHKNFGIPIQGSTLPCGDINPSGITGTPVIDPSTNTLFFVAYIQQRGHVLFAISLRDGATIFSQNVNPPGVDDSVEQQRGALGLSKGMIYIPYGGLAGDCGQYHGFVVGVPENDSFSSPIAYQTPTGREGGIWAPSGMSIDSNGNIFVATGNSNATTIFDFGDAVIRLTPTLKEVDYFAPTNWAQLNSEDMDLGSVAPAILGNDTIFQVGKEGIGYLLNETQLGGIGGQEFLAQACSGTAFSGTAYFAPILYVACTSGITALRVNLTQMNFTALWSGPSFDAGAPIVSGNAVWAIDYGSGILYAFNETTGATIFKYSLGQVVHFETPSSGNGRIFAAGNDTIQSFTI